MIFLLWEKRFKFFYNYQYIIFHFFNCCSILCSWYWRPERCVTWYLPVMVGEVMVFTELVLVESQSEVVGGRTEHHVLALSWPSSDWLMSSPGAPGSAVTLCGRRQRLHLCRLVMETRYNYSECPHTLQSSDSFCLTNIYLAALPSLNLSSADFYIFLISHLHILPG